MSTILGAIINFYNIKGNNNIKKNQLKIDFIMIICYLIFIQALMKFWK